MGTKNIPDHILKVAKSRYMNYDPVTVISKDLGVSRTSIQYHVSEHWKAEREKCKSDLLNEISANKKAKIYEISDMSLNLIKEAFREIKERGCAPTAQEARNIMTVLNDLDKIIRLDDGQPTDIIGNTKPATIIELREKLALDPFSVENADFKELETPSED